MNDHWGTLVWLMMTTGIRRGEVCALRFYDLDIDFDDEDRENEGVLEVHRNYVHQASFEKDKTTKTHQMRSIALDRENVVLLREHRDRVKAGLEELGKEFTPDLFVFTGLKALDHSPPIPPTPSPPDTKAWPTAWASTPTFTPYATTPPPRY